MIAMGCVTVKRGAACKNSARVSLCLGEQFRRIAPPNSITEFIFELIIEMPSELSPLDDWPSHAAAADMARSSRRLERQTSIR